ncbi:MAG: TIGR02444 family protein [Proteobacteria bacterium]|nr:TIGR02444 family protein [Pseudomonadota bacterium]
MSAFWTYTLEFYRRDGVQPAVIHLQDARGADVNLLIHAAWTAALDLPATTPAGAAALAASVAAWRETAIEPLRAVRNALRPGVAYVPEEECKALRGQVLKLEIEAERVEQALLEAGTVGAAGREAGEPDPQRVAQNLAAVAALNPAPLSGADRDALRAVLAAACQGASVAQVDAALASMT